MKRVKLMKYVFNKIYNEVCIFKYLSDTFPTNNSAKQGDALS
jgi:hypothetical protein